MRTKEIINKKLINDLLIKYRISLPIEDIEKRYSEFHRYYHTTEHINFIIDKIFKRELSKKDTEILIVSALFHDIIYIPNSKTNEKDSADLLLKYSEYSTDIQIIYDIIIDTSNHIPRTKLSTIFCDIDMMSITDTTFEELKKNSNDISKEFSHFMDKDKIKKGQIEFIKGILNTKYGMKNRENLLNLIDYMDKDMKFLESYNSFIS